MEKIKELFKRYREIIVYVIVGGLTTVVNFVIFYLCKITFGTSTAFTMNLANFLAWVVAVLFAFVTNKLYVFESKSMERKVLFKEFTSFVAARVFSLGSIGFIVPLGMSHMFPLYTAPSILPDLQYNETRLCDIFQIFAYSAVVKYSIKIPPLKNSNHI